MIQRAAWAEGAIQIRGARTRAELDALVMKRAELRKQLESNTERRVLLGVQRGQAEGTALAEVDARIKALDDRTARIDQELNAIDDAVSAALGSGVTVERARQGITIMPPMIRGGSNSEMRQMVGNLMAFNGVGFALLVLLLWRSTRLRGGGGARGATRLAPEESARIDQLQRAVDVIAVEVERISEGQRYVTKMLNEKVPAGGERKV